MGASPTPRNAEPGPVVAVAFSGGRDSTALLHATVHAAQRQGGLQVAALHVHHGLHSEADAWQAHAAALCRRWRARRLPLIFRSTRLASQPAPGDSVEAWARRERYAALADLARSVGASRVLLAQHRRDQAETVLLQALRSGGPAGLAAMPASIERDGLRWERPWLDRPREAIEAYVRRYRLKYVDDGSNDDPRFARNRLRLQVWPALCGAFDDAESTLAAVAQRAQEADAVLREVAAADLQALAAGTALDLNAWQQLSPARGANALRAWLAQQLGRRPAEALVQRLLDELPGTPRGSARWPVDEQLECRAYRGQLQCGSRVSAASPDAQVLDLSRPGRHALPDWGGALEVHSVRRGGVAAEALVALVLRARQGGERFQLAPGALARSLKKQFQARGVPEWERTGPLLHAQGRLLFVPGLGIDARWWHEGSGPRRQLRWLPGAG